MPTGKEPNNAEAGVETPEQEQPPVQAKEVNWEELYKGLQGRHQKVVEESQALRSDRETLSTLVRRFDSIEEDLAILRDGQVGIEQDPEKTSSAMERLNQERAWRRVVEAKGKDLQEIITDAELDSNAPELAGSRQLWSQGDLDGAIRAANRVAMQTLKGKAAQAKTVTDQAKADKERADIEKAGLLDTDTGHPGGAGSPSTMGEAYRLYNEGRLSDEDLMRAKKTLKY